MRPYPEIGVILHLSIFISVIRQACSQEKNGAGQGDYNTKNGYNQYGGSNVQQPLYNYNNEYNDYYSNGDSRSPYQHFCYSCIFQVVGGHAAGEEGCRDPFKHDEIPQVPCESSCGKVYHKLGEWDYLVSRQCMPNCKEMKDEKKYMECCSEKLCNSSPSLYSYSLLFYSAAVSVLYYVLTR